MNKLRVFWITIWLLYTTITHDIQNKINTVFDENQKIENTEKVKEDSTIKIDNNTIKFILDSINTWNIIQRNLSDIQDTPLSKISKKRQTIWEYLWYEQWNEIIKQYNNWTDSLDYSNIKLDSFSTISFPLIPNHLDSIIPKSIDSLLTNSDFIKYKEDISRDQNLIAIIKTSDNKHALAKYINWNLVLTTNISIWKNRATPRWLFKAWTKMPSPMSNKFKCYLPYAIFIDNEYIKSTKIFMHQWEVDGTPLSHGCIRIPWLYGEILYHITDTWTKSTTTWTDIIIPDNVY